MRDGFGYVCALLGSYYPNYIVGQTGRAIHTPTLGMDIRYLGVPRKSAAAGTVL